MHIEKEWFENWFDTSFYHILYDYRNDDEAKFFMSKLISFLNLTQGDKILDLPCGKGRHSLFLNSQGFNTTGADLSVNSVQHAQQFQKEGLSFEIHDMRNPLNGTYDSIFNLFTSFGYFNQESTNIKVLENFKNAIKKDGHIVIDFLNLHKVVKNLVPKQQIRKQGVDFLIKKRVTENFIIKEIEVTFKKEVHHYMEKVQALDLDKMEKFAKVANLEIQHVFGDYELNAFDSENSDRLILIMQ